MACGKSIQRYAPLILSLLISAPRVQAQESVPPPAPAPASTTKDATNPTAPSEDLFKTLDYPELQVVPRASERLLMEAEAERSNALYVNWQVTLASLATLASGVTSRGSYRSSSATQEEQDATNDVTTIATLVGASGLLAAVILPMTNPYGASLQKIRTIRGNDKKAQLMRERLAEETLERQASLANLLRYATVGLGFVLNMNLSNRVAKEKTLYPTTAAILSLLPLVFAPSQTLTWRKHQEYKRKIYTPVAGLGFNWNSQSASLEPQYILSWQFE